MKLKTVGGSINLILIGCGPHGQRFYLPAIRRFGVEYGAKLSLIVELREKEAEVREYCLQNGLAPRMVFTDPFSGNNLPEALAGELSRLAAAEGINAAIICTDPLNHVSYAKWALSNGLHLMLDKPVSARRDAVFSLEGAEGLRRDYLELTEVYAAARRDAGVICSLCVHRRYHPAIELIADTIAGVSGKTGCPVTNMHLYHSDGQWRLPDEMATQRHHSYFEGHGKVSHSGFHFLDCLVRFYQAGIRDADRAADEVAVLSKFMFPPSHLLQVSESDYQVLFGTAYRERIRQLDYGQLSQPNFGELDAELDFTFSKCGTPQTFGHISLLHNGFSRRSWLTPGADLYKGNGRVKHEEHRIHVGPFLCVHALSWQAKDMHDLDNRCENDPGGNNHFEVNIFRNSGIVGGSPFEKVQLAELPACRGFDKSKLLIEEIKARSVSEFFSVIRGRMPESEMLSELCSHRLAVELMSAVYKSHVGKTVCTVKTEQS